MKFAPFEEFQIKEDKQTSMIKRTIQSNMSGTKLAKPKLAETKNHNN